MVTSERMHETSVCIANTSICIQPKKGRLNDSFLVELGWAFAYYAVI